MTNGEKLKDIRRIKKMSAKAVAEKINLSQSYLSKIENDQVRGTTETLELVLSAYDMTLEQFFDNGGHSAEYKELVSELQKLQPDQLRNITNLIRSLTEIK